MLDTHKKLKYILKMKVCFQRSNNINIVLYKI